VTSACSETRGGGGKEEEDDDDDTDEEEKRGEEEEERGEEEEKEERSGVSDGGDPQRGRCWLEQVINSNQQYIWQYIWLQQEAVKAISISIAFTISICRQYLCQSSVSA